MAQQAGNKGSVPGLGRCPGQGNGNPRQYSCLRNLRNGGASRATVHGSQRVGHDLATKQQYSYTCFPLGSIVTSYLFFILLLSTLTCSYGLAMSLTRLLLFLNPA